MAAKLPFGCMSLLAATVLALAGGGAVLAQDALAGKQAMIVGMHYVVPPFVGGTKVRTPEAVDTALAEALAEGMRARLVAVSTTQVAATAADPAAPRASLIALEPQQSLPATLVTIPTGYKAGAMAIMRTDTDITSWEQLKGRTVCLSEGSRYVGKMASQYGAIEMVKRAPADSLLALRIGSCDAAVHDNVMLEQLLTFPEWKKFSAQLRPSSVSPLVFAVPADDAATVAATKRLAAAWKADSYLAKLNQQRVRDIAFEVYLDQNVPDCH
ncbi:type 2 periplasmic-binding domain-containing protein [Pollutimonas thiosulfatoxidans]|nr:transporter substrate-binding domain-containing protein [Pollutimonas thiosulfatoxidans]